jgi:mono/diheme cytochrome c family protein
MKRYVFIVFLFLSIGGLVISATIAEKANALPEYAAQTGEPCATCHVSPSGGGPRTPRGQAWVAEKKPSTVPDLVAALEALGVHLTTDLSAYQSPAEPPAPAQPLQVEPIQARQIQEWLSAYDGN